MSINKFFLTLWIKRIPIQKAKRFFARLKAEYESDPEEFMYKKRTQIVEFHSKKNPFYKSITAGKINGEWHTLPVLSKKDFQRDPHFFLTPEFQLYHYKSKTSGSSGTPLVYYKDKFAHALTWTEIVENYRRHGIDYGKSLQARFYAIPLEGLNYYIERLKDFLSARYRFVIHDMSDAKLAAFVKVFERRPFEYAYGYTNSLVLFAKYLNRQSLILKEICPTLRICVVTSEVCSVEDRELLQKTFGVPVVNEYGVSEVGLLAFEDSALNWRISGELLYIEILDDNNQPLPYGEIGKIVVTQYFNKAMPFIRYEVGDRGALWCDEQGIVYLKQLYGRLNDVLVLSDGKIVPGFTLYYVTKAMMERLPSMREYNIKQTAIDEITFYLIADYEPVKEQQDEIRKIVAKYLNTDIKIVFKVVDKIERLPSGKMKHFQAL